MSDLPIHEQKRQQIKQVLADVHRLHGMDERESMVLMTLDEAMKYWDEMAPDAKNIQAVANAIELECYIRRSERIASEPIQPGRRTDLEPVTPGVRGSGTEKKERSHMRTVGKHATVAREYVKAERKANRHATKKGIVRHVKKAVTPKEPRGVVTFSPTPNVANPLPVQPPRQPKTETAGQEHLAALARVADGRRRTDRELERMVGNVLNFLKWLYLIPWLTIDRNSEGTLFIIDQELRDICEGRAPRPVLNGVSIRGFLTHLRAEITRRRKANHDERRNARWTTTTINSREQTDLLNWIETELDRIP